MLGHQHLIDEGQAQTTLAQSESVSTSVTEISGTSVARSGFRGLRSVKKRFSDFDKASRYLNKRVFCKRNGPAVKLIKPSRMQTVVKRLSPTPKPTRNLFLTFTTDQGRFLAERWVSKLLDLPVEAKDEIPPTEDKTDIERSTPTTESTTNESSFTSLESGTMPVFEEQDRDVNEEAIRDLVPACFEDKFDKTDIERSTPTTESTTNESSVTSLESESTTNESSVTSLESGTVPFFEEQDRAVYEEAIRDLVPACFEDRFDEFDDLSVIPTSRPLTPDTQQQYNPELGSTSQDTTVRHITTPVPENELHLDHLSSAGPSHHVNENEAHLRRFDHLSSAGPLHHMNENEAHLYRFDHLAGPSHHMNANEAHLRRFDHLSSAGPSHHMNENEAHLRRFDNLSSAGPSHHMNENEAHLRRFDQLPSAGPSHHMNENEAHLSSAGPSHHIDEHLNLPFDFEELKRQIQNLSNDYSNSTLVSDEEETEWDIILTTVEILERQIIDNTHNFVNRMKSLKRNIVALHDILKNDSTVDEGNIKEVKEALKFIKRFKE